jgi:hypothetical protein
MLAAKCYTIMVKNRYLSDGTTVDTVDVDGPVKKDKEVASTNIGHKLLQMMGWTGGGLGKGGAGISEPITATAICNREGLGAKTPAHIFKRKIKQIVEEYATSTNPYDLVFTTGFDNDQRKEMHL